MQPNIVFITCHDLGQHLHCYGIESVHSPHLDQLAAQGVLFEHNFCTAPQCSPSRAALHTGRHAHANGVMGLAHHPFDWRYTEGEIHMPQRLKDLGYDTTLFGIQHVTQWEWVTENPGILGYDRTFPLDKAERMGDRAAEFIAHHANGSQPFYLEVGFVEPHRAYDMYGTEPDTEHGVEILPYIPDTPAAREDFAALQGMIRALDEGVGRILAALDASGLRENTWVIFVTDHGLAMPRAKCTLYDPGIETALIMHWPGGGVTGGRRFDALTSHVDVVPTMMEALGIPLPGNLHGRSYWSLLQGDEYMRRSHVYAEKTYHSDYDPQRAVRSEQYKLIINFEIGFQVDVPTDIVKSPTYPTMLDQLVETRVPVELYDLRADPQERINLAGQPEYAAIEDELRRRLLAWMNETGDPLLNGPIPSPYYTGAMDYLQRNGG